MKTCVYSSRQNYVRVNGDEWSTLFDYLSKNGYKNPMQNAAKVGSKNSHIIRRIGRRINAEPNAAVSRFFIIISPVVLRGEQNSPRCFLYESMPIIGRCTLYIP